MTLAAAAPVLWPFAGSEPALDLALAGMIAGLLALVPLGWVFLRRRWGLTVAGPLWPLLFFEILAGAYAFLTPPWQMPDEPQHMLYVELVREAGTAIPERLVAGRAPQAGDQELILAEARTRVLASLERTDMERWLPDAAALVPHGFIPGPVEITHPPLYYELAATLTRPLDGANILGRLAVLRALGVAVMGWCVWACGAAARMLWPRRRRLAEAPLVLAAGVPTVAAFAGAANNDVLMNLVGAAFVLLLVAAVTGWVRRYPLPWAALFMVTVLAGVMTKRTVGALLLALPLAVVALVRWNLRRALFAAVAVQLVAGMTLLTLPRHRAAQWDGPAGGIGQAFRCDGGHRGGTSLCFRGSEPAQLSQTLPLADVRDLAGHELTLGMWVNGRHPNDVVIVNVSGTDGALWLPALPGWNFLSRAVQLPASQRALTISIAAPPAAGVLRVDGVALARGRFSQAPPLYADGGRTLRWDGRSATNHVRNGSGRVASFSAPDWLPDSAQRAANGFLDAPAELVRGWSATVRSLDILSERTGRTFSMFWATAGWLVPPLLLPLPLLIALGALTVAGWAGAVAAFRRRRSRSPWSPGLGVASAVALALSAAVVLRDLPPDTDLVVSGRYLFSGLVALTVVLVAGWRRLWPDDDRSFRNAVRWLAAGLHSVFLVTIFLPFLAR